MTYQLTAEEHEIALDFTKLMSRGPIKFEMVNIYGRKINTGDPGPDSHPINSTAIQRTWVGGGQKNVLVPSTDVDRFYWATLQTQYPAYLTLPPLTHDYDPPTGATGTPTMLGDYPPASKDMLAAWGSKLTCYDPTNDVWTVVATLAGIPLKHGVTYRLQSGASAGQDWFFLPETDGHEIWKGSGTPTHCANEVAFDFCVFDGKLFRIDDKGKLWYTTDGMTWTGSASLVDGSNPRNLILGYDKTDKPTLYVITDHVAWILDFDAAVLHFTTLKLPQHPKAGLAADWNNGVLAVATGLGLHNYNSGTITATGLDHDQGLPPEYRGWIVDLHACYSGLYALVQGVSSGETNLAETHTLDLGTTGLGFYVPSNPSYSLLMIYDGIGWHYQWGGEGDPPTNVLTSVASPGESFYRVWWGAGGQAHMQKISFTYFNPSDPNTTVMEFAGNGLIDTGWYDWGWYGQYKVLKKFEIFTSNLDDGDSVQVSYQLDNDPTPTFLGFITTNGKHSFYFGPSTPWRILPNMESKPYAGVLHNRVKFILGIHRDDASIHNHPVIEWYARVGRRVLTPQRTWTFDVDLTKKYHDGAPTALAEFLEDLASQPLGHLFLHRKKHYVVDVVAINGPDSVDDKHPDAYVRTVHLIESNEIDLSDGEVSGPSVLE